MPGLNDALTFTHGPAWRSRFALAPLTNSQSNNDGTLGDAEYEWLTHRAAGGFAMVMTAGAAVQKSGIGFPGQLGIWSDAHLPGLTRLAAGLRAGGAVSSAQLYHAGMRARTEISGMPARAPSDDAKSGAVGLTTDEVEQLREDFITAALRAEAAGFDGAEYHAAHGYLPCLFLSAEANRRTDRYGGSLENRARLLFEVIEGIRARTRPGFQLGVRISPERWGMRMGEQLELAGRLLADARIDYVDMSLWDCFKRPEEADYAGKTLLEWFATLPREGVRLGVAGKLMGAADCRRAMEAGADFVMIGRGAILHHDFPKLAGDAGFTAHALPVTREWLLKERLSPGFVDYMATWKGFVAEAA